MAWGCEHNIACWSLQSQLLGARGPHVAGLLHGQQPQVVFSGPAEPRVLQHSSCGDVLLCSRQHPPALSSMGRLQNGILRSSWKPGQEPLTAISSSSSSSEDSRLWAHLPSWQHTQDVTWSPDGSQLGLLQVKGATLVDWERKSPVATLHTSGCGTLRFLHSSTSSSGSNSSSSASRLVLMRPGELLLWDVRSSPTRSSSTQRLQVAHPKTRLTCCEVLPGADVAAVAAEGGQVQLWDLRKAGGVKSLGACGAHQGQVICTLPLTRPLHQRQRQQQLVSPATGTPPGTLQVVQGAAGAAGARVEAAQLLLNPVAPHLLGVVGHTEVCLLDLLTGQVVEVVSLINAVIPSSSEATPSAGQQQQQQQQAPGRAQPQQPGSTGAIDPASGAGTTTSNPSSGHNTSSQAQQDPMRQYRQQQVPVAPCQQSCWDAAGIVLWTQGLEALSDPGSPEGGFVLPTLAQVHFSSAGGRSSSSSSSIGVIAAQLAARSKAGGGANVGATAAEGGDSAAPGGHAGTAAQPSNGFTTAAAVLGRGDAGQQESNAAVCPGSNVCGMPTVVHRLVGGCPVVFSAHAPSGSMMVATFDGQLQWW